MLWSFCSVMNLPMSGVNEEIPVTTGYQNRKRSQRWAWIYVLRFQSRLRSLHHLWLGYKMADFITTVKFSYFDKDSISHRTNNFITRLTRVMNIYIFTFTP